MKELIGRHSVVTVVGATILLVIMFDKEKRVMKGASNICSWLSDKASGLFAQDSSMKKAMVYETRVEEFCSLNDKITEDKGCIAVAMAGYSHEVSVQNRAIDIEIAQNQAYSCVDGAEESKESSVDVERTQARWSEFRAALATYPEFDFDSKHSAADLAQHMTELENYHQQIIQTASQLLGDSYTKLRESRLLLRSSPRSTLSSSV